MDEQILQRILVAKHLLAANNDQLTPNSDAVAVARMVLVAHDAAELALAAIASHLNVQGLPREKTYLMDYPDRIAKAAEKPFSGGEFLKQLNTARVGFKHVGILPDARTWYQVIIRTRDWTDQWCQTYLGIGLDEIDLENLLADATIRHLYTQAKRTHSEGKYREALEALAYALNVLLLDVPGLKRPPTVGQRSTEDAVMLAAFGVRPSDYLTLQDLLPHMSFDFEKGGFKLKWQNRDTGHMGNWTADNVRFCLEAFLDLALKVQHASPVPKAYSYLTVFDDTITPSGESANLFKAQHDPLSGRVLGYSTVSRTIRRGEILRCHLTAPAPGGLPALGSEIETAEILDVWLNHRKPLEAPEVLRVHRKDVVIGTMPRDIEWVRAQLPHLFLDSGEKETPSP